MRLQTKLLFIAATVILAACTSPGRFGAGGNEAALGAASDPTSPAYFQQTIGDRVLFAVNESTLSEEAQAILREQAAWLLANPEYTAVIEGHADERGTREYNLALGARRANAVYEFLVAQGVSPDRLRTISYGKERPLAICSNESCYAQNRRAVTVITLAGTS
jgi:peptidoglycan-associated lipoprotein